MGKYLDYAIAAVTLDLFMPAIACMQGSFGPKDFFAMSSVLFVLTTLPAIPLNVFDKYVNQNISDNKDFQYGAIVLEIGLIGLAVYKIFELSISDFLGPICIILMKKAFLIKAILDNDTSDTDFSYEVLPNNTALSVISDYS